MALFGIPDIFYNFSLTTIISVVAKQRGSFITV